MALSRPEGGLGDTNLDFGKSVFCWQFQKDCLPALIKQPVAVWNRHLQTVICRRFVASILPGCPNQRHVHSFCCQLTSNAARALLREGRRKLGGVSRRVP